MQNATFDSSHLLGVYNCKRSDQAGTARGVAKIPALLKHCTMAHGPNGIEKTNIQSNGLTECDAEKPGIFCHGAEKVWSAVVAQVASDSSRAKHPWIFVSDYARNFHCHAGFLSST